MSKCDNCAIMQEMNECIKEKNYECTKTTRNN